MTKVSDIQDAINYIIDDSEDIRTILCADIAFAAKYIKHSTFPQSKTFNDEITKIFNIVNLYHKYLHYKDIDEDSEDIYSRIKLRLTHPYLKNREEYNNLVELSKRSDSQALAAILSKIPKYRNILSLFELYSILRIVNEFSIEYSQFIKVTYFEERLKLCEK